MLFKKIFIYCFAAVALLLSSAQHSEASSEGDIAIVAGATPINISQAEELVVKSGAVFVDVNLPEVRSESGYIAGAVLADIEKLEQFLPKDKNTILVFYCLNRLCAASSESSLAAEKLGYKTTYVMLGGIEGWVLSGRPVMKEYIVRWMSADKDNVTDTVHLGFQFGEIPACRDCHGSDGIKVEKANTKILINDNCASCHKQERSIFDNSSHTDKAKSMIKDAYIADTSGKKDEKEKQKPNCWDCHAIHKPYLFADMNRKQAANSVCAKCHEEKQNLMQQTFHGKGLFLTAKDDMPTLPACFDCHSPHNQHKVDNPKSTLFGSTRVQTCEKCHEGSHESFASYISHPDKTNKESNAVIYYVSLFFICLITIVFIFFGIHTVLWWTRMLMMKRANPEAWKEARHAAHNDSIVIRRFNLLHRLQHFFMAASFLTLSLTGLPQMFYSAPWAKNIASLFGGPIIITKIHHVAAIILFIVFVTHIIEVSAVAWRRKDSIRNPETGKLEFKRFLKAFFGPESLFPRMQDLKDMVAHIKWFLYLGPRPQFDRWTYWEKFDYLAEVWGMFTFGITGLILWFPTFFLSFMPGWVANMAAVIHSYEALLAIGFIFAVHFFNTHFRIDRFPMDMVIFSGTITKEEMMQERKMWYDRLESAGKLNELTENVGGFEKYAIVTRVIGFLMLGLGLLFLGLMIYAFII